MVEFVDGNFKAQLGAGYEGQLSLTLCHQMSACPYALSMAFDYGTLSIVDWFLNPTIVSFSKDQISVEKR